MRLPPRSAAASATSSRFGSVRSPCGSAKFRPVRAVSAKLRTAMPRAAGSSANAWSGLMSGSAIGGRPDGTGPRTRTPSLGRSRMAVAASAARRAGSAIGTRGSQRSPARMAASTKPPSTAEGTLAVVCDRAIPRAPRIALGSTFRKSTPPRTFRASDNGRPPRIFGIWPRATLMPTPVMYPTRSGRDRNSERNPRVARRMAMNTTATRSARAEAIRIRSSAATASGAMAAPTSAAVAASGPTMSRRDEPNTAYARSGTREA